MKYIIHLVVQLILIILLVGASVSLGYTAEPIIRNTLSKVQGNYEDTSGCNDLDLVDTAYCLRNYVSEFYIYNKTQDLIKLDLEQLKKRGGDCKNWADYYEDQASALGFSIERPVVITGEDKTHTFTIISDETGYCILDQMSVSCHGLKNDN